MKPRSELEHKLPSNSKQGMVDVLQIQLPDIPDAFFEPHKTSFCVTLADWHKISPQAKDVAKLALEALQIRGVKGSDEMTLLLRYRAVEAGRTVVEIAVVTSAIGGPTESDVQKAVLPVLAELHGQIDLHAHTTEDFDLTIPNELRESIHEFQKTNAGRRPAVAMNIVAGNKSIAVIQDGVWRTPAQPLPEGRRYAAQAFCNGLMCDSRLVFLKECMGNKITGRKFEAHYDQKAHEAMILSTAGRPDCYLDLMLREEYTRKSLITHVIDMKVIKLDPSDFQFTPA